MPHRAKNIVAEQVSNRDPFLRKMQMPCVNGWKMRQKGLSVCRAVLREKYNHNAESAGEKVSFHARSGRLNLKNGNSIVESGSAMMWMAVNTPRIPRK